MIPVRPWTRRRQTLLAVSRPSRVSLIKKYRSTLSRACPRFPSLLLSTGDFRRPAGNLFSDTMADKDKEMIVAISPTTSSSSSADTVAMAEKPEVDPSQPFWRLVIKGEKAAGGGGNVHFVCTLCHRQFTGSYTRVKAHFLQIRGVGIRSCNRVNRDMLKELKQEQEAADRSKNSKNSNELSVPFTNFEKKDTLKKRKMGIEANETIEEAFKNERAEIDRLIGRFFFSSLIPFNVARSPYWIDLAKSLVDFNFPGYVPPSPEKLRTVLLTEEKKYINHLLGRKKFSWKQYGVSIVSYGWSDIQRQPMINFFACSLNEPIFLKPVDASRGYKDVEFLKELFIEVIKEVGEGNVVQIITDDSPICNRVGLILASDPKYSHIFWTYCVRGSLNLALKSICNPSKEDANAYSLCSWIEELEKDARNIKIFITDHQHALSIFSRHTDIELLKVVETRCASSVMMMKGIKQIKTALMMMVIDKDWDLYLSEENAMAQTIKNCILDDLWWEKITYFLQFTEPILEMLSEVDKEGPMLYRVYDMWGNMIEKIKNVIFKHEKKNASIDDSRFFKHIHAILVTIWDNNTTDLHYVAHSLNPMYYGQKWLSGGFGRVPPNEDPNVSSHMMKYLRRLISDDYMMEAVSREFEKFSSGGFDSEIALLARDDEDPFLWWASYGWETPTLQALAMKLLCQPATSSYCERSKFIYSRTNIFKGSIPIHQKAEDLIYVHFNLQLFSRTLIDDSSKSSTAWDVYLKDFDLEGEEDDLNTINIDFAVPILPSNSDDGIGG
ncbi:unnamed protein product [Victoria cruziana]